MVADQPYPMAPTIQSSTRHTCTPPTHYLNLPRQQYVVPTHHGQTFTQRGPIPANPTWEKPWRAHHTKGPCRSYFGSRLKSHSSGQKGGERDRVDFCKAAEVIHQVIVFTQSLPHMMNNRRNVERWIWQWEIRQSKSRQSTTSQELEPQLPELPRTQPPVSSATSSCQTQDLSLVPLPHPGANAYRPPMLCKQPPHLNLVT